MILTTREALVVIQAHQNLGEDSGYSVETEAEKAALETALEQAFESNAEQYKKRIIFNVGR